MSKHTPGPWIIDENIAMIKSNPQALGDQEYICELYDKVNDLGNEWTDDSMSGEIVANARLIAAAPEMFELLKKMQDATLDIQLAFLLQDAGELIDKIWGIE